MNERIREQLHTTPMAPGVYLMKDTAGEIIYIGKAKRLKARLSSYFKENIKDYKTRALVRNIHEFEYILTRDEQEALLLESNLIKENKPKYNIRLKDDKNYPFVKISPDEYPYVIRVRDRNTKGAFYGPYASNEVLVEALEAVHKIFPIRKCTYNLKTVKRPCLYYHIGACIAPCKEEFDREAYTKYMEEIRMFFSGDKRAVLEELRKRQEGAAKELNFEQAIIYRDYIKAVEALTLHPNIVLGDSGEADYLAYYKGRDMLCICILVSRRGAIIDRQLFVFNQGIDREEREILEEFIIQYYSDTSYMPKHLIVEDVEDAGLIEEHFREHFGRTVHLEIPKIGNKKKTIVMAKQNAQEYVDKFDKKIKLDEERDEEIRIILQSITGADKVQRLECYDISHIFGKMSVGSMVVYEDFKKKNNDYRKFKIKQAGKADDPGAIREVITRRLKRIGDSAFAKVPDIIFVDGGRNQVNAACSVMEEMGMDIPVIGLVKNKFHKTDHLYYEGREIPLDKRSVVYRFLYAMQEEVHRFALSYHNRLRTKSLSFSVLSSIKGVGKKRQEALMKAFGSVAGVCSATVEELMSVDTINEKTARNIYEYFRNTKLD